MESPTTLITAPFRMRRFQPALARAEHAIVCEDVEAHQLDARQFTIESADALVVRESANALLRRRYGWRGYQTVNLPRNQTCDRTTLTAVEGGAVIGTITVVLDGAAAMSCEQGFPAEMAALRARYGQICEFTKLAVDPGAGTQRVLAALFHVGYIVASQLRKHGAVVMEVNPRHVRFYERMLGGQVLGEERINTTVNAPSVLLAIDFKHVAAQIARCNNGLAGSNDRSLYPLAFTTQEETGILSRLIEAQKPTSKAFN